MILDFRHPVIAGGVHPGFLEEKLFVGFVTTQVEIAELSVADVVEAFGIEGQSEAVIISYEGLLYSPATYHARGPARFP